MCVGPARWDGRARAAMVSVKEGFSPSSQHQKTAELGLARPGAAIVGIHLGG